VAYLLGLTKVSIKCRNWMAAEMHLKKQTQQVFISPGC
jgi:hypothetical protein